MNYYVGEIRQVGFTFAPVGWLLCQGQLVSIADNEVLYTLLGTTYGGDGIQTFGLPDLRGRSPIGIGSGGGATYVQGQLGGQESVTLTSLQLPVHTHPIGAQTGVGTQASPANGVFAALASVGQYEAFTAGTNSASMLTATGGSQPHDNLMPYLTINYIISTYGIFPSAS